jgi:hypothetical protein
MTTPARSRIHALERVVPAVEWQAFAEATTTEFADLPVVLDVASPGELARPLARGLLEDLSYDPRGHVIEVAVRIPTPGAAAVLRHLITRPVTVNTVARGLSPTTVLIWDDDGELTRLRLVDTAAFSG